MLAYVVALSVRKVTEENFEFEKRPRVRVDVLSIHVEDIQQLSQTHRDTFVSLYLEFDKKSMTHRFDLNCFT